MISELPAPVLQLIVNRAETAPRSETPNSDVHNGVDGGMTHVVAEQKARGIPDAAIVDLLDRRIRRYIESVGTRGQGERNSTAYRIARWLLNDFQTGEPVAWAYLAEWNAGNAPPLTERELRLTFRSAKRSGARRPGCAHDSRGTAA